MLSQGTVVENGGTLRFPGLVSAWIHRWVKITDKSLKMRDINIFLALRHSDRLVGTDYFKSVASADFATRAETFPIVAVGWGFVGKIEIDRTKV